MLLETLLACCNVDFIVLQQLKNVAKRLQVPESISVYFMTGKAKGQYI